MTCSSHSLPAGASKNSFPHRVQGCTGPCDSGPQAYIPWTPPLPVRCFPDRLPPSPPPPVCPPCLQSNLLLFIWENYSSSLAALPAVLPYYPIAGQLAIQQLATLTAYGSLAVYSPADSPYSPVFTHLGMYLLWSLP